MLILNSNLDLKIPNWEIVKYLPKPIIPHEFTQIKDRIEEFKNSLKQFNKLNVVLQRDVKIRMEQLLTYEFNPVNQMKQNTELVENLNETISNYEHLIDQAENKFFPENLIKLKIKLNHLYDFLVDRIKTIESEQNYLNMYKTLNFPLIFNCHKDDSIKPMFNFDNSNAEIVYYNIISISNITEKKFHDYYFPPTEKSLFNSINSLQSKQKIKWLRPESIRYDYDNHSELTIYQNPNENELKHGFLGNYWLLSGKLTH